MVRVGESQCSCGYCGTMFYGEWDLEYVNSCERPMGEESEYSGELYAECPKCGNSIVGEMDVREYPVGCLESKEIIRVTDTKETGKSEVKEPSVEFFDL